MLLLKEVKYVAEQYKSSIDETMKDKEMNEVAETEDTTQNLHIENGKFKCSNCKNVVSSEDTFDIHMEKKNMTMCQYWTLVTKYG